MKRRRFLKTTLATVALALTATSVALRSTVADLFSKARPRRRAVKLPPAPKWNKITDDIDWNDSQRRSQDYERSLLPRDFVFPRPGQIWTVVRDCEVPSPPLIGPKGSLFFPKVLLRKGQRVRILPLDNPKPLLVRFELLPCRERHESRTANGLQQEFWLRTTRVVRISKKETGGFNELFMLVEDVA